MRGREDKMAKSKKRKNRKEQSHRKSHYALQDVRLSSDTPVANGGWLTGSTLDHIADQTVSDICRRVSAGAELGGTVVGFAADGRYIVFHEGPPEGATSVVRHLGAFGIVNSGSVMDNLDLVGEMVHRLDLVALMAYGETWYGNTTSVASGPLSRSEALGRSEGCFVEVVAPDLDYHRFDLAPIVSTPFGRLASPDITLDLHGAAATSQIARCFDISRSWPKAS